MSDRLLRDRIGEAMRLAAHHPGPRIPRWNDPRDRAEEVREHWRVEADRLLLFARQCGFAIVPAAGGSDG